MRGAIDHHFDDPGNHGAGHHVWNYWYVPGLYAYLRALPERIIDASLVDAFVRQLRLWSLERLGLGSVTPPFLSMYVDGCRQQLHNDAGNGRFAYVFSLTRWADRRFSGGETVLFSEDPYMGTARMTASGAGTDFLDLVAPNFNQLLVFDDRILHAVERIEGGAMSPFDSRLVLHGHFQEAGVVVDGSLLPSDVEPVFRGLASELDAAAARLRGSLHGMISFRLDVSADEGTVSVVRLIDRLFTIDGDIGACEDAARQFEQVLARIRLPPRGGPSRIFVPLVFKRLAVM